MKKKALALILSLTMLVSSVVPGLLVSANGTTTSDITTIEEVETPLSSGEDETQPPEGGSTTNPTNPGEGGTEGGTTNPGEGGTEGGTTNPGEGGTEGGTTNPGEGGNEGGTTNPGEGGNEGGTTNPGEGGNEGGNTNPGEGEGNEGGETNPGEGGTEGGETDISAEELYNRFMACTSIEQIEALRAQVSEEDWAKLTDEQKAKIEEYIANLKGEGGETDVSAEELYNRFMACKTIEEIEALKAQLTEEDWAKLTDDQKAAIEKYIAELEQASEGLPFDQLPLEEQQVVMAMVMADTQDAGTIIDAKWFSFTKDGKSVEAPTGFSGFPAGDITIDTAPKYPEADNYVFEKATYNNTEVYSVGQVNYNGGSYVYYETKDSANSPVRLVLPDYGKIVLNYKQTAVDITYTVTVDNQPQNPQDDGSISVSGIPYGQATESTVTVIPATNPKTVFPGNGYTFEVSIPRGYTARVTVNGGEELTPELGVSPSYTLKNDTVVKDEGTDYLTHALYTVEKAEGAQTVTVALTPDNAHNFSAELISQTKYFGEQHRGERVSSTKVNDNNGYTGDFTGDTVSWVFETEHNIQRWEYPQPKWLLNVLQINGVDLTIPFTDNQTITTTLPSGTEISIERIIQYSETGFLDREKHTWYKYTITATNCHEDLVVTGGNLNGTTHNEYMPYAFNNVVDVFGYYDKTEGWLNAAESQPFAADTVGSDSTGYQFRFKLKPGYANPTFSINDIKWSNLSGNDEFVYSETDGYYYLKAKQVSYPALITINAKEILMKVAYQAGQSEDEKPIHADNMPTDDNQYSLSGEHEILIPTNIPVDQENKYVFLGWMNGNHTGEDGKAPLYQPGDKVELADLDGNYDTVTFTAKWINAALAEKINITVEIWDMDKQDEKIGELTNIQVPKGTSVVVKLDSPVVQKWFTDNPAYKSAQPQENQPVYTPAYIKEHGNTVKLEVREKEATIEYKVVGPDGEVDTEGKVGTVKPESELVKVKTGEAQGATPTVGTGYRFVGWFTDENCEKPVDENWIGNGNKLTPQKTDDMWVENPKDDEKENVITYYAKFEVGYADLTIEAKAAKDADPDQCFIYNINGEGISMKVAVPAGSSRTICHLPIGSYTVTEQGSWSWRYNQETEQTKEIVYGKENTVSFNHTLEKTQWLSGCSHNIDAVKSFFGGLLSMMK